MQALTEQEMKDVIERLKALKCQTEDMLLEKLNADMRSEVCKIINELNTFIKLSKI